MGIAPLAVAEFFCSSPQHRTTMEREIQHFLSTVPGVIPPPSAHDQQEFLARLMADVPPEPAAESKEPVKLGASFLTAKADSCYGSLFLFDFPMGCAAADHWDLCAQVCDQLLARSLCSSVMFRHGCEKTIPLFGKLFSPAVTACPDFAKLALLKRLDMLDDAHLKDVVPLLDSTALKEKFCQSRWKALLSECRTDSRFSPVLLPPV